MPFDPKKFVELSKQLQNGTTEAHYRTLINRAYYGAFGYIRDCLGVAVVEMSVHRKVIESLKRSSSISEKKAGKSLERLFKKRKEADYDYRIEVKQHSCSYCISEAEEIIKLFEQSNQ